MGPIGNRGIRHHMMTLCRPLTFTASAEEQSTATADSYWKWSGGDGNWYHLHEDGSHEWWCRKV